MDAQEEYSLTRNQVHILYNQSVVTFLFPVIFAVFLCYILKDVASSGLLIGWTVTVMIYSLSRYLLLWMYNYKDVNHENVHIWLALFIVSVFISGITWGLAAVILIPYEPQHLVNYTLYNGLVVLMICGLVAGAIVSYSVNLLVISAYSCPALLLPSLYLISLGDKINSALGGFVFLYFIFANISALRLKKQLSHYLHIQYKYKTIYDQYHNLKSRREHRG